MNPENKSLHYLPFFSFRFNAHTNIHINPYIHLSFFTTYITGQMVI